MAQLVIGNWKSNGNRAKARELAAAIANGIAQGKVPAGVSLGVAPPFVHVETVAKALEGSSVALAAQTCGTEKEGAFTGEVAPEMLADVGVQMALAGHSERRALYGETDAVVAKKTRAILRAGLRPVVCVGETLAERDANQQDAVVRRQMKAVFDGLEAAQAAKCVVAYEPVWAIGTGRTATPAQAGAMHETVRGVLRDLYGASQAAATPILYGGSVKADNMEALAATPGVDGALVGGASLDAKSFLAIAENAVKGESKRTKGS
jgi:triosephosphate isomerase